MFLESWDGMSYVGMREKTLGLLNVKPVSALRNADVFISRFAKLINQTIVTGGYCAGYCIRHQKSGNEQYRHSPCSPGTPSGGRRHGTNRAWGLKRSREAGSCY